MWLIDTRTLRLKFFQECPNGKYAILSHVWQDDEMSFSEFQAWDGAGTERLGLLKIIKCCEKARDLKLAYAWVDTCCIDKSSSAELSEAVNSMYNWYSKAYVCFTFLVDVDLKAEGERWNIFAQFEQLPPISMDAVPSLASSRWFTRGWTLQELIAPDEVLFFDSKWSLICSKRQIAPKLQEITGISEGSVLCNKNISQLSIAHKMSWAATRKTTRAEDMAYCLLGVFDVNMPLLYGEGGEKAFMRLQQAILSVSDDESIFAWSGISNRGSGMLAPSAANFRGLGDIQRLSAFLYQRPAYSMTNRGLSITAQLYPISANTYLMPLLCTMDSPIEGQVRSRLALVLYRINEDTYARVQISTYHRGQLDKSTSDIAVVFNSRNCERLTYKRRPEASRLDFVRPYNEPLNLVDFDEPHPAAFRKSQIYIANGCASNPIVECSVILEYSCHIRHGRVECRYPWGEILSPSTKAACQDASSNARVEVGDLFNGLQLGHDGKSDSDTVLNTSILGSILIQFLLWYFLLLRKIQVRGLLWLL